MRLNYSTHICICSESLSWSMFIVSSAGVHPFACGLVTFKFLPRTVSSESGLTYGSSFILKEGWWLQRALF